MKKLILISILFIVAYSTTPSGNEPPKWINTFNNSDYYFESVGISGSNNESILQALMEIAGYIEAQLKSEKKQIIEESGLGDDIAAQFSRSSKNIIEKTFGKVKIKGFTKHFREETGLGDSTEILEYFERVGELTFANGNKKLKYSYYLSEEGVGKDSSIKHNFEIVEVNCTLKDLIDELNSVGCNFEFYNDNEDHYTLVRCEKKRILENIKKQ